MSLDSTDITRIAKLARLELDSEAHKQLNSELNDMFNLIETLQSVETSDVEPLSHPLSLNQTISLRLRDDIVTETSGVPERESLMSNAPAKSEGLFLVPKVIE
ncbi:Asp-tRNA(Asn)/Glu-tRNA(Gln) amidotransferase subunit GatC [Taylorella asinigenitalis]|uniref:Aspartyl/glutamyl-tRNA(Asn/Gln) amidotransferase subunit C n=1 Tax=Taylorella asinigenitalis (strain MCE3) TaxID=1008459 RepID=G4QDF0_TAYAM|nr:Asp-tRNA(Asn)/Glu-tRNA(Gln) amidotransferase subunit GatC [Taylorella asinigenitalis]AEP35967.1 Aspartyl-tRNA(Asn) amidotransferase subunit C [Taylorella asinigenitalis MCE3]